MTYAILGAGNVGQAIGRAFARKGLPVLLASRRPAIELEPIAQSIGKGVTAASMAEALKADVIVLATPFGALTEVASALDSWQGKIVIDATNAFGVPLEELAGRPSSAVNAEALRGAALVKAFNHLPAAVLNQDPEIGGFARVLFLASDSDEATAKVADLVTKLGYAPVALGRLDEGGLLVQARGNQWAPLIFQDLFKKVG